MHSWLFLNSTWAHNPQVKGPRRELRVIGLQGCAGFGEMKARYGSERMAPRRLSMQGLALRQLGLRTAEHGL